MTKATPNKQAASGSPGQNPLDELDRVFHEKARLGILTAVISLEQGVNFSDLKRQCELTDGNLNRHLKVLTDAKILKVRKTGRGRSTNSVYSLTTFGRRAFENYLDALESVVREAQAAAKQIRTEPRIVVAPD